MSRANDIEQFNRLVHPWNLDSAKEQLIYRRRANSLLAHKEEFLRIPRSDTWLLGYLSSYQLDSDVKEVERLKDNAQDMEDVVRGVEAQKKAEDLGTRQKSAQDLGRKNGIKYLTWECLDIYVATSMRTAWEFEETYDLVSQVFEEHLSDLRSIRFFDPTQSYEDGIVDKGLIEALMLRRAKCTIYMAQDGDTLGKDSELAATLAQAKPVIAFVRQITDSQLSKYVVELKKRPLRFLYQRLLTLLADGFFDRADNLEKVYDKLEVIDKKLQIGLEAKVIEIVNLLNRFVTESRFLLVGDEEVAFFRENRHLIEVAQKIVAAVDAVASDNRADNISSKHPLSMQVHLNSGVANGILVARDAKTCAELVRAVLLGQLEFDIIPFNKLGMDRSLAEEGANTLGIGLFETKTRSRFRVVTTNESLTNSFWNFYGH
jgi:hypothetical protein